MRTTTALIQSARAIGLFLALAWAPWAWAGGNCLEIRNGYFWDPAAGDYFIPRGVAYQIWNPPVGANQSLDQVDYDLLEFKKLHANSVRVEMTWGQVEIGPDQYDWTKPDHLVKQAEDLGLKLFVIIGYQYPPAWFPTNGHGINNQGLLSDVINYEDPQARAVYQKYIATVTARYHNSPAIGAWILGNEYAYFDLWEDFNLYPARRFLGYDPISQQSFRHYLQSLYHTNIAALNANWLTSYADFDSVVMPLEYPADRHLPGYQDLIQWRKQSVGNYVALGAVAAQQADPNHLRTYSMVGGLFNGRDANYTCEDAKAIVACCAAAGAKLDFWSINNYAWASLGNEMRSAAFGIGKYQAESGLPVMISETGHSSTENLFDYDSTTGYSYAGARQPKALPSTMWESLLSGAIGVHFFNWNDRSQFTSDSLFYRERGFGIVQENRQPKQPVYDNLAAMFRQMDNLHLDHLLGGSSNPPPDVQYFWSTNADMVWPRANQENAMIWGALKRLGFQPGIIDDQGFEQGAYTNAPALLLSRCYQMNPLHLQRLATEVIPAGIHIHAEADLPGQFDAYDRANPDWASLMRTLFGIDVSTATPGFDLIVTNDCYSPIHLRGATTLGPITPSYAVDLATWKLWQNVTPVSARVILTAFGFSPLSNSQPDCPYLDLTPYPALLVNSTGPGRGKTAVNPFALGDTYNWSGPPAGQWGARYTILRAIYRDHFGLQPVIDLSGPGSDHVLSTYRICANGSVLIALLNEGTNTAFLTLSAPALLTGRKVEDLSRGGVLTRNSSGSLTYANQGDDCVVLYAYKSNGQQDDSLVNPNPNKLWFQTAPLAVWPTGFPTNLSVGYDTTDANLALTVTLEQTSPRQTVYARSSSDSVSGRGSLVVQVPVPDADANNPDYISSHQGGQYVFHAVLQQAGVPVSDVSLPVRLLFGVHPTQPFQRVIPGQTYPVSLAWEELPSYLSGNYTPLDRAALWDSLAVGVEHYRVVLQLQTGGQVVASDSFLTSEGTGSHAFSIQVPSGAIGPFTWEAYLQTATNVFSHNVEESFEGYPRGANWQGPGLPFLTNNFLAPWISTTYAYPWTNIWLNQGVQLEGSDGSQSAFIVASYPSWVLLSTFGMYYEFTNDWALPADTSQWTNYVFSYDFRESHGYPCSVEMQVKNADPTGSGKWIQYTNLYSPGPNSWFTTQASLDQFHPPPGLFGVFEPDKVHAIVVNIRMLTPDVQYVGSFDNIRFLGPEVDQGGGSTTSIYTSANDVLGWLTIQPGASGVSVSWIGDGVLQSANEVGGPWRELTNASNPFLVKPLLSQHFYQLRR